MKRKGLLLLLLSKFFFLYLKTNKDTTQNFSVKVH